MNKRDDFTQQIKDKLYERVGGKCSNPNCRKETKGPHSNPTKSVSIGVAAHITAASEGGPRYDSEMSSEERRSIENGIWLCSTCAKMIDSDPDAYPVELLRNWKKMAEDEQARIINQGEIFLTKKDLSESSRKMVAYREIKKALDILHGLLQFAYNYWSCNFKDRYQGISLEKELAVHSKLYENELEVIRNYTKQCQELHKILLEYSLDIGQDVSQKINTYCNYLEFSYQKDGCGFYNNYWVCFFQMLETYFDSLESLKKDIDDSLRKQYYILRGH